MGRCIARAGVGLMVVLGGLAAGPPAGAQELKIGYVDVARIFDGYRRTQESDAALEQKAEQKEGELEGRVGELKKLRESLELLSEDARQQRVRQIEAKADELKRFRTNTARDLRGERDAIAQQILQEIRQAIEAYGQAHGFTFMLDARSVVYGAPAADVTDAVLQQLNGSYRGRR